MTVQSPSTMLAIALRTLGFMLTVIDPSTLRRVNMLISSRLKNRESAHSVKVRSRPVGAPASGRCSMVAPEPTAGDYDEHVWVPSMP